MDAKNGAPGGGAANGLMLVVAMTSLAMVAFAANSLLTRAAFQTTAIDATSFTAIRGNGVEPG